jgi:hypothetical protein
MRITIVLCLLCLYLLSCRYNKVSVKIRNNSDYDFKSLTVRYGDTLQLIKDFKRGETTAHFWSNQTYGQNFTKIVLPNLDTLVYFPINRQNKKVYYRGKILTSIRIEKSKEQPDRDTILVKTRRRIFF